MTTRDLSETLRISPRFSFIFIVTILVLMWIGWTAFDSYHLIKVVREKNIKLERLRGEILLYDEVLTMSARMAAATGNRRWEERYRQFEPLLGKAIKETLDLAPQVYFGTGAAKTDAANTVLVELETKAFEQVQANQFSEAQKILFGDEYEKQKLIYAEGMKEIDANLEKLTDASLRNEEQKALLRLMAVIGAVVMLFVGWFIFLQIVRRWQISFMETNKELREQANNLAELNRSLDLRVLQRTQELEASHKATLNMMIDAEEARAKAEQAQKALEQERQELAHSVFSLNREIDERTKVEEKLKKAHEQLSAAEKIALANRLAAGVAHEVKNPLAVLQQGVNFIEQNVKTRDPRLGDVTKGMNEAVHRADTIIRGLIELSRPTQLTLASEDLNVVIDKALLLVKNDLDRGTVEVKKDFQKDLPRVQLDQNKVVQIFINLFTNALDAMPKGGRLDVKTFLKPYSGESGGNGVHMYVAVEISDTGVGISEDVLTKIFEPFFTTKRAKGGTGLGLAVVKSIVEMHSGVIQLKNGREGGVQATLMFPLDKIEGHKETKTKEHGKW